METVAKFVSRTPNGMGLANAAILASILVRPGRGVANVVAQVESPSAKLHVSRLLDSIERNLHPSEPASLATR